MAYRVTRHLPFLAWQALLYGLLAVSATAQPQGAGTSPQAVPDSAAKVSPDNADIAITATVKARELTFEVVGDARLAFPGYPERDTLSITERQNLPKPVTAGVTYRDIGIRLTIVSAFADIDRIVAEALGEVPATQDGTPQRPARSPSEPKQPERRNR